MWTNSRGISDENPSKISGVSLRNSWDFWEERLKRNVKNISRRNTQQKSWLNFRCWSAGKSLKENSRENRKPQQKYLRVRGRGFERIFVETLTLRQNYTFKQFCWEYPLYKECRRFKKNIYLRIPRGTSRRFSDRPSRRDQRVTWINSWRNC